MSAETDDGRAALAAARDKLARLLARAYAYVPKHTVLAASIRAELPAIDEEDTR